MNENNTDNERGVPKIAIVVFVLVVVAVVAFIVLGKKEAYAPTVAGSDSIDFTLPDLSGKQVSLKDFRGKVVFLNFWATWCKPCEEEMPSMQALYNTLQGQPFEIVAVSVDKDGAATVAEYAKKYGLTFPILLDAKGKIKEEYKTTGVPETFIIDQNGVVAEKVWGPRDWTTLSAVKTITTLLREGPKDREAYKVKGK